ncbi:MAG TPA: MBL fold metallo-hydrolase [Flavobacteriales bacterium]|nr:MBL fold metallo-hydrolase [Flavobacteriales bacterium]
MIQIKSFAFNPFSENTFLLYDETKECLIVDPGCYEAHEKEELCNFIREKELKPVRLVNTHCHIDHVLGVKYIADTYGLNFQFHKMDMPVFESTEMVAQMYGIPNVEMPITPSAFLDESDVVEFGVSKLDVLFVPGHSPGHIAFINKEQKFTISGDVLFYGSIGRTDLPGGEHETLINSIKTKLLPLGDDFVVYSGHGPETNIGFERMNNPFLT